MTHALHKLERASDLGKLLHSGGKQIVPVIWRWPPHIHSASAISKGDRAWSGSISHSLTRPDPSVHRRCHQHAMVMRMPRSGGERYSLDEEEIDGKSPEKSQAAGQKEWGSKG